MHHTLFEKHSRLERKRVALSTPTDSRYLFVFSSIHLRLLFSSTSATRPAPV